MTTMVDLIQHEIERLSGVGTESCGGFTTVMAARTVEWTLRGLAYGDFFDGKSSASPRTVDAAHSLLYGLVATVGGIVPNHDDTNRVADCVLLWLKEEHAECFAQKDAS
jgi:hypothetical protein